MLDTVNSKIRFKYEKLGLLFVNTFRWNKGLSKNLLSEIFEIIEPMARAICTIGIE